MLKFSSIVILLLISSSLLGQKKIKTEFDIKDFSEKAAVAEWLVRYDMVAWWTSDSVSAQSEEELIRIGKEWFCFQTSDDLWHAVYGKYKDNSYDLVFHYCVDTTGRVKRSIEPVDTTLLNEYARALVTASETVNMYRDSLNLAFNQYIRQNDDKTFSVWIFPAFQPNNYAVYGGEFVYTISADGRKILKDESYLSGKFRAYEVGEKRDIYLNYKEMEKPTIGCVFFLWYYKSYFSTIYLENKYYTTAPFKMENDSYTWIHMEREENSTKKSKRKKGE